MDMSNVTTVDVKKYKFMSKVRIEKIKKLKKEEDILLSFGCELLLNKALKDIDPSISLPINYEYDKFGKPYLIDLPYKISFSHSNKKAVLAISNKNIGIDIQYHEQVKYLKVAKRYFAQEEVNVIVTAKDFYNIWTRKEAYSKFNGKGLGIGFKDVVIMPNMINKKYNCYCSILNEFLDYSLCVVSEKKENIKVIRL